jgi:hypothetical protein
LGREDLDRNDIWSRYDRYNGVYHRLTLQEAIGETIGDETPIRSSYLVTGTLPFTCGGLQRLDRAVTAY